MAVVADVIVVCGQLGQLFECYNFSVLVAAVVCSNQC